MVMRIIHYDLNSHLEKIVCDNVSAIGFFDGLHRGHQELIKEAIRVAKEKNIVSSIITFFPSPKSVLLNEEESLLTTIVERIQLAKSFGLDQFIILRFSKNLAQLSPEDFHKQIIKRLNIKHLVCGQDFRYGHKGSGSKETLKLVSDLGLSVINDFKIDDVRISSTLIKEKITNGYVNQANDLLGYLYQMNGYVKHGRKKGRTIGFPTLNLHYENSKVLVSNGVYLGISTIQGENYISTINVGNNPTINTTKNTSVESYVHNYSADTYNQKVIFRFVRRIRPEIKFSSVEGLIAQMKLDIETTNEFFTEENKQKYNIK